MNDWNLAPSLAGGLITTVGPGNGSGSRGEQIPHSPVLPFVKRKSVGLQKSYEL